MTDINSHITAGDWHFWWHEDAQRWMQGEGDERLSRNVSSPATIALLEEFVELDRAHYRICKRHRDLRYMITELSRVAESDLVDPK